MKKKIYYILLLVVTILLMGCQEKNSVSEEQGNKNNHIETEVATEPDIQSEEETLESKIELATHGCQVVQEGETMSLNGMNITVNDVKVTRKKGDWNDDLSTELDENGVMTDDVAYVVINVSIERTAENKSFWLNSIWLAYFSDDNMRIGLIQLDGASLFKEDDGNPDRYEGLVEVGDTLTTDLIYIIDESIKEEIENMHFLLHYNKTGLAFDYSGPEDNCMTYLKSLENIEDKVDEEETLKSTIELATHGCQVVHEDETMSLNGMNITVNDVTVTKKKGDWYDFLSQKLDEKGHLFENRAYVIVNVTIEQVEEEDFWLNSIRLAYFLDDNLRIGSIELDGTSLFKEDDGNPDAFQGLIKKGETLTTDLIYVIKEEEEGAGAHFLLEYNPTGCGLDYVEPDKYGMIYLKSLEDVWNEIPMEE